MLATVIPGGDFPLGIEHGNGLVLDSIQEKMKTLLRGMGLVRALLSAFPLLLNTRDCRTATFAKNRKNHSKEDKANELRHSLGTSFRVHPEEKHRTKDHRKGSG